MKGFYQPRKYTSNKGKYVETLIKAPDGITGIWRRELSSDGMTLTYRKVA